jgi:hypothetical protein
MTVMRPHIYGNASKLEPPTGLGPIRVKLHIINK